MIFISDFMESPVSSEFNWMRHYFKKGVCLDFLKYFSNFRTDVHFSEHMGRPCSKRWTKRLKRRFLALEGVRRVAKKDMDIELVAEIEMGNFKLD